MSIKDIEDRSDFDLSQMKSVIPGVTASEISGIVCENKNAPFMGYMDEKNVIKEDEDENQETMKKDDLAVTVMAGGS